MSEDYKAQASYKFGTNQQAMLNLRAESVPELHVLATEAAEGHVLESLTNLDANLQAVSALAASGATQGSPAPAYTPPAAPPQQPVYPQTPPPAQPQGKTCPHGARQHKTGVGAKGPWSAWFCPTPKGTPGQCAPEWDRA